MQQNQQRPAQSSTNTRVRRSPAHKVNDKRRNAMIAKRRHKVRVLTQPTPFTPTSTAPVPMVATLNTQTPMVRSTAESLPVTIHKLAMGQFANVPHPTTRSINDNPPQLEDIPSVPVRQGPLGPMKVWHQRICLKPGRTSLFLPLQSTCPTRPSKQRNNPKLQQSSMP